MKKIKKRRKASSRTKEIRQADALWSILVRQRDGGRCVVPGCGKTNVGAHHIFSRRHHGTRWNVDNGLTLCYGHHIWGAHHEPELFRDLTIKLIGEDKFNQLKVLAYLPTKVDVSLILLGLKKLVG